MTPTRRVRVSRHSESNDLFNDDVLIIDPSYRRLQQQQPPPSRVYVDRDGYQHDPNYRIFPMIDTDLARKRKAMTKTRSSSRTSGFYPDSDDDEMDVQLTHDDPFNRRASYPSHRYAPPMSSSFSSASTSSSPASSKSSLPRDLRAPGRVSRFSSSPTDVTPPRRFSLSTSVRSSPLAWNIRESPLEEENSVEAPSIPSRWRQRRWSRRSSMEDDSSVIEKPFPLRRSESLMQAPRRILRKRVSTMEEDKTNLAPIEPADDVQDDAVPTCTNSIRREWHIISLRVRFATHRAKRRIQRRTSTL